MDEASRYRVMFAVITRCLVRDHDVARVKLIALLLNDRFALFVYSHLGYPRVVRAEPRSLRLLQYSRQSLLVIRREFLLCCAECVAAGKAVVL